MKQESAKQLWKRRLSMGLSLAMAVTLLPAGQFQADAADAAPALLKARSTSGVEGQTYTRNQPFIANVTGATEDGEARPYFNAPAFVVKETIGFSEIGECAVPTASNTVLIAAAEGRFDQEKKAGGTDVIAAVSKDKGATWTYSYPLRFPDSSGNAGKNATSINNPSLVVDKDGTIYCLMNVTPTGVSSLAEEGDGFKYPNAGTGYVDIDGTQRLAVCSGDTADQDPSTYAFYVGDFDTNGYAKLMNKEGGTESEYAVDKWYNLYQKSGEEYVAMTQKRATAGGIANGSDDVQQNLFYAGSRLHVYNTSYIVCVTSTDGLSWTAPEILNPYVKKADGKSLVVAGGKGLCTSQNRLVFPVYRNNDGTDADGKASVIWLDKSTGGTNSWHRSDDVPEFEDAGEAANSWVGEGEIVELSDGKLRMVFRNGQGLISYADAQRDKDNRFVFSAPVATGTRSPENARPSVISYMKPIEEKKGLLIAAPVGENRAYGRIMTFLATGNGVEGDGEDSAAGAMTRVEGADVPGSSSYFRNPSMDQFNAGDNIGLLWENGNGRVRFNNFPILNIVKNHYIPHVTVELDMAVGDTYERTYTVVGDTHIKDGLTERPMSGGAPDTSVIDVEFTEGEAVEEDVPALYAHKSKKSPMNEAFNTTPDTLDKTIEKAEFTITRPDNTKPDEYVVYSQLERRYFSNSNANGNFQALRPAQNIIITKTPSKYGKKADASKSDEENDAAVLEEGEFAVLKKSGENTADRVMLLNKPQFWIDGWAAWTRSDLDPAWVLLEKIDENELEEGQADSTELIPGYKRVTEITPNKKYLFAYPLGSEFNRGGAPFDDTSITPVIILYPRNGGQLQTKLVYGTRKSARKAENTLKITAKAKGTARVVANHITYNITCHESEIEMMKGEKRFFAGVDANDCSTESDQIATVTDFTLKEPSLFDCLRQSNNNLNGYSTEANTDIDMSGAEFLFEAAEGGDDYYTIRSVATGSYLINLPGAQYFGNQKITHQLIRAEAEGGEEAFEIRRKSNDEHNDRYVYYYYPKMGFDAVSIKNDNFVRNGNFAFALLEKQEYPSDLDQISGYRRVSKITSGKTYLITQTYVESSTKRTVRFVLYPGNSIQNQSKMYQDVETKGVRLTAVGSVGDSTNVTIGERSYKVSITEACSHEGYGRYYKGAKEPSCEEEGYTGDMYCENCDEIVEQGTKIEAGHDIPAASWQVSTSQAPSFTEDGQYVGVCRKCGKTQTKPYTKNEYATQQLNAKLVTARSYREADYTVKSYAPLKDALNKAQNVEDTAEAKKALIDEFDAAIAGLELKSEFNAAKAKLKEKLVKMKEALSKEEAAFAPEVWTALNAASDELKKAEIGIDLSALADAAAIDAKLEELKLSVLNAAWEKVEDVSTNTIEEEKEEQERKDLADQIKNACSDAKAIIDAGQGSYTDESWKAFEDAYKAANLKESVLLSKTKEELQKLFDDLKTAKENLKTKEPEKDEAFEAAKTEVADAVKAADAVAGAGQKNYTKESWDAFMKAYNEAKNPPANADAAMLKKLAAALKAAQAALVTAPENTLVKGQTEDVGGIRYQVLDPVKRTVTAKLGLKKKASSIKIPATVKVKGETCTVVQIANKAFKGYSKAKKLTIGKNVTTIGKQAFLNCKKLKTVTLQSKVLKNIKAKAFKGTAKNPKVKWPKGLKKAKKKTLTRSFKKQGLKIK